MKKNFIFAAVVVLLIALFVATVAVIARTELARLEIINKSHLPVSISLTEGNTFYYVTVAPESSKTFTVERKLYDRTTWACDKSDSGTLDMKTRVRLVFTKCYGTPATQGEPTILERVHIPDSPVSDAWRYK